VIIYSKKRLTFVDTVSINVISLAYNNCKDVLHFVNDTNKNL